MAKIVVVKNAYEADVKAIKVASEHEADILVFMDKLGATALGDTRWYLVGLFQASTKLYWAAPDDPCDLKVFFVEDASQARWVTQDHPLRGRL
jgi:hypothetical protein